MKKNRLTFRESQQVQGQLVDADAPAQEQVVTTAEIETAIEDQTGEPAEAEQVQQVTESLKRKGVKVVESRRRFNQNQQTQVATQEVVDQIIADQVITPQEIEGKVQEITGSDATPEQVQQIAESLKRKGFKVLESGKRRFNQNQQTSQQTVPAQEITTDQIEAAIEAETEVPATQEQVQQIAESLKKRGAKIVESKKRNRSSRMNESASPLKIKKIKLFGA